MTNLPKSVADQAKRAEELMQRMAEERARVEESVPAAVEDQRDADEPEEGDGGQAVQGNPDGEPQGEPGEPQPGESPEEHRYKVLQGKYKAEVGRLSARNSQLQEELRAASANSRFLLQEVTELKDRLAKMEKDGQGGASAPASAPTVPDADGINPADFEDYGEEVAKLAAFVKQQAEVMKAQAETIARYEGKLSTVDTLAQRQAQDSERMFLFRLSEVCPSWQALNTDPDFLAWLDQPAPYSRYAKRFEFEDAAKNRDADSVAAFFNGFLRDSGRAPAPQGGSAPRQRPAPSVTPPRGGTQAPTVQPNKRVWSAGEFMELGRELSLGRITQDEYNRRYAEGMRAYAEGRVR